MNINQLFLIACLMSGGTLTATANTPAVAMADQLMVNADADKMKEMKQLAKLCKMPRIKATENAVTNAIKTVKHLALQRQDDYVVTGDAYHDKIKLQDVRNLAKAVNGLAAGASMRNTEAQEYLDLLLDFMSSQKLYDRFPKFRYSNYTDIRKVPKDFLSALEVCDDTRKEGLINGMLTLLEWDVVRQGDEAAKRWVSSDYLYNVIPYIYTCAVLNPNKEQGLKDMETFAHFIDLCTLYSPGGKDLLKPDGTSFHHRTHYIGYMYSFRTWVEYMHKLKGTSFRISKPAYERIRKAVVTEYMMAVKSKNDDNRIMASSMAGRHPYYGSPITFTAKALEQLIEVGGDIEGKEYDEVLASYYNAFYMTNKYKGVAPAKLDGYYQYNYSPAGVYRKDNWMAVMRCPTTKFWGGEIYSKTNRFGRYQSHGSLEVIYEGGLAATGYPADKKTKSAGWDWNVIPGTTTVHYSDWKEMLPNRNNTDRFDQWSKTTNFAGALAGDDCGLFAADFDQNDNWAKEKFVPTHLSFRKSVLAVDGMLYSVGNGISALGEYPEWITATNLFQNIVDKKGTAFVVNGEVVKKGQELLVDSKKSVWMLTPSTTGFYVPAGHDQLVIKHDQQQSYSSEGMEKNSLGEVVAAKAYINHGVKPEGKGYEFMVVPAADAQRMAKLAKECAAGKLFVTALMEKDIHVVKYVPQQLLAYTFFAPASGLKEGQVIASATELLLMEQLHGSQLKLSLCNPNLRPKNLDGKDWTATETPAAVELKGQWKLNGNAEGVTLESKGGNTLLKVTLNDGEKVDVLLTK